MNQAELIELIRNGRSTELDHYFQKDVDPFILMKGAQVENLKLTPLMLASLNGHDTIVRTILNLTCIDKLYIEQKESVHDTGGNLVNKVTALWCALDRGHFQVARTLIELGKADVNNGPLSPLLIEFVKKNRLDVVQFLVENGYADVNRTVSHDQYQHTSLCICASKDYIEIGHYLISRHADINYQTPLLKLSPLHIAVENNSLTMVRLLCSVRASLSMKNSSGETPLVCAAIAGKLDIVSCILEYYNDESVFNDLELGASLYMYPNCINAQIRFAIGVQLLRLSLNGRAKWSIPKIIASPIAAYDNQHECQTINELEQIQDNPDRLCTEVLLMLERTLSNRDDKKLLTILRRRIIDLAIQHQFNRCLHLLVHVLRLYPKDRNLNLKCFILIFNKMIRANIPIPPDQFLDVCYQMFELSQLTMNKDHIKDILYFMAFAAKILEQQLITDEDRHSIIQWIKQVCRQRPETIYGQTLLHLSVGDQAYFDENHRLQFITRNIKFPNISVAKILLCHGRQWINVNAVDGIQRDTVLHLIARHWHLHDNNEKKILIDLLINQKAHMDCVNARGKTPLEEAVDYDIRTILKSKQPFPRLKCICARNINNQKLEYDHIWPKSVELNTFLSLHGGFQRSSHT